MWERFAEAIIGWVGAHPTLSSLIALYVFSSIVSGMPTPTEKSGIAYRWVFGALHLLAANWARLVATRAPQYLPGSPQWVGFEKIINDVRKPRKNGEA